MGKCRFKFHEANLFSRSALLARSHWFGPLPTAGQVVMDAMRFSPSEYTALVRSWETRSSALQDLGAGVICVGHVARVAATKTCGSFLKCKPWHFFLCSKFFSRGGEKYLPQHLSKYFQNIPSENLPSKAHPKILHCSAQYSRPLFPAVLKFFPKSGIS